MQTDSECNGRVEEAVSLRRRGKKLRQMLAVEKNSQIAAQAKFICWSQPMVGKAQFRVRTVSGHGMDPGVGGVARRFQQKDVPLDPKLFLIPEPVRNAQFTDDLQASEARLFQYLAMEGFFDGLASDFERAARNLHGNLGQVRVPKEQKLVKSLAISTDNKSTDLFDDGKFLG